VDPHFVPFVSFCSKNAVLPDCGHELISPPPCADNVFPVTEFDMLRTWFVVAALLFAAAAGAQERPQWVGPTMRLPPPAAEAPPSEVVPTPEPTSESIVIPDTSGWNVWQPAFWDAAVWDPWEGSVELGLSGTEGNSETFNVRFGLKAKHKTPRLVRTLEITSIQKTAAGITTANTALIDGRLEWPMPNSLHPRPGGVRRVQSV